MVDVSTAIQGAEVKKSVPIEDFWRWEREIRGISSIFGAARKYGSAWIGQVILIGWKCSATLTVKLNYAQNKNTSFFLLKIHAFPKSYLKSKKQFPFRTFCSLSTRYG